jgi:hypothetical protein
MSVFSSVHIDLKGTREGLQTGIEQALAQGAQGLLLLLCADNPMDVERLPADFTDLSISVVGAVFPGIIVGANHYRRGSIVCGLRARHSLCLIQELQRPLEMIERDLEQCLSRGATTGAVVITDAPYENIDNFVACLHDRLGPEISVIGGGAGDLSASKRPCLITKDGLFGNAAIIVNLSVTFASSIRHGWKQVAGPFLVTHAERNMLYSLNYQPAMTLYRETLRRFAGVTFADEDFVRVSRAFPFGMEQLDDEFLVRDLLSQHGEAIECVGRIPTNAMIYILHAEQRELIRAAADAAKALSRQLSPRYDSDGGLFVFVIDCISRALYLDDAFSQELISIQQALPQQAKMIGVLSLGEIANSSQGTIHFLNKTTVIGGIGR